MDFRTSVEQEIEAIFRERVLGKSPPPRSVSGHDGEIGHWLEEQFGVTPNNHGEADFKGYELKKDTRGKTTFGDWSADKYLFTKGLEVMTRDSFIQTFGTPKPSRGNRHSWSGSCVPKVSGWNDVGQKLHVAENGDIFALYSFERDTRPMKSDLIPEEMRSEVVPIAIWLADSLRTHVEDKFDVFGWFSVRKNRMGVYDKLVFGQRIDFHFWIHAVRAGEIYLDSGMVEGDNKRNYSQWRANNAFWDALIVRTVQ